MSRPIQPHHTLIVIGAGPAGAGAALRLAQLGHRVTLIERQTLPRPKVCGGCLHERGVQLLQEWGAGHLLGNADTHALRTLELRAGPASLQLPHRHGRVVDRTRFDHALALLAQEQGVTLIDGQSARIHTDAATPCVRLGNGDTLTCDAVVVADGIAGSALGNEQAWQPVRAPTSHVGAGAWLPGPIDLEPGTVRMHIGRAGYLGAVAHPDHGVELAAALSPRAIRAKRSPAAVAVELLEHCNAAPAWIDAASQAHWRLTPPLTVHRPRVAGPGVFVLGDSAGYTEPITGQGITWALRSAHAVAPIIDAQLRGSLAPADAVHRWQRWVEQHQRRDHARCRWTARLLRQHRLVRAALCASSWFYSPSSTRDFIAHPTTRDHTGAHA